MVTYRNLQRKSTFGEDGAKVISIEIPDTKQVIMGNAICGELAESIRTGEVKSIIVNLE
jgi:hypothetical protein